MLVERRRPRDLAFCFLLAIPWLIDTQGQLWTAAWRDAAMLVALLVATLWLLRRPGRWTLSRPALMALCLAALPLVQLATGTIRFKGDAWLASGYLLAFALAVLLGSRLQSPEAGVRVQAISGCMWFAGMMTAAIMVAQASGLDQHTGFILTPADVSRLAGNVGQPNNAATLLVCALASMLGFCPLRERGSKVGVGACSILLLTALAMTQSRAGNLAYLVVGAIAAHHAPLLGGNRPQAWRLFACSLAWLIVSWLGWQHWVATQFPSLDTGSRLAPGTRLAHWTVLTQSLMDRPWWGWGWQQIANAQAAHVTSAPPTGEAMQYAHNMALDLALWNGIPLAALVAWLAAKWLMGAGRRVTTTTDLSLLCCVIAMLVHAMVELPHGYLLFLVPAGLTVGALTPSATPTTNARAVAAGGLVVLLTGGTLASSDFFALEDAWRAYRFQRAHIVGYESLPPVPEVRLLDQLQAPVIAARIDPTATLQPVDLELLRDVARRYPNWGNVLRLALAQQHAGDTTGAANTLLWLQHVVPPQACIPARQLWTERRGLAGSDGPQFPTCPQAQEAAQGESGH